MRKGVLRLLNFILACLLGMFAIGYTYAWYTNKENLPLQIMGSATTYFAGGSGTEQDPYQLSNAQHVFNLAYLQNKGELNKGTKYYFQLNNSIDMTGVILSPIGNDINPFCGEFNGNGHTLYNLVVSTNKNILNEADPARGSAYAFSNAVGFFGMTAKESNIKNVLLSNPVVEVASASTAGVSTNYSTTSDYGNCVGIAIGYIKADASSIGVIGGKLAIRREKYSTINSILGGAADDVTVNITGGNADVGIFYPDPSSNIADIISKNGNKGTTTYENGMWLIPAKTDSALGSFSITSKPTINNSRTVYGSEKNAYLVGKNQTINTVLDGKDYSSYITDETGKTITSISGYLSFSGMAEQDSYDTLYYETDTYGTPQKDYGAGSYAVQQNAIKFNITNDNSYVYVIAASNSSDQTRYLGLYKTTDKTTGDAVDYSDPADFYQLYQCTGDEHHSQHEYYWTKKENNKESTATTMIYYDGTTYFDGKNYDVATCNRTVDCKGTVEYANGQYLCNVCGKVYEASQIQFTNECLLHGGTGKEVQTGGQANSYLYQSYNFTSPTNTVAGATANAANDNSYYGITISQISGTKREGDGFYYNPIQNNNGGEYQYETTTDLPVKFNSDGKLTFTAQLNGTVTLSGRTETAKKIRLTRGASAASELISIEDSLTYYTTYTDTQNGQTVTHRVYDWSYTFTVEAGVQYSLKRGDNEFALSTLTYVSADKIGDTMLVCSESETNHAQTDFKIDNTNLAHTRICGATIEEVQAAKYQEVVATTVTAQMTLTGTPTFHIFKIAKKGSYQLASMGSGIRIYYLRVKGMYGGNARLSNVTNIDFVYDGVTIENETYTEDGTTYTVTEFRKDKVDYYETNTCISLVDNCPAIILYFYRDGDGKYFAVGSSVSGKTSGFPTYTTLVGDISIGSDFVDTPWVYTPN